MTPNENLLKHQSQGCNMTDRAASQFHVEFCIFRHILNEIDLTELKEKMVVDDVSEKRFEKGAESAANYIANLRDRRKHRLPKNHVDYEAKV